MKNDSIFYDYGDHHVSLSQVKKSSCPSCEEKRKAGSGVPYQKQETPRQNHYLQNQATEVKKNSVRQPTAQEIRRGASQSARANTGNLSVYKFDIANGARLEGALFEITSEEGMHKTAESNESGLLRFGLPAGRSYTLREIAPPPGYNLNDTVYHITVSNSGKVRINGRTASQLVIPTTVGKAYISQLGVEDDEAEIEAEPEAEDFYPQVRQKTVPYEHHEEAELEQEHEELSPEAQEAFISEEVY